MNPLVSIIIPAYNCEKWIADSIKSALAQTWPNKEIIVVDDGSTDRTLKVAKQFESKILKVIHQENRGAAAARNTGLKIAQGDYIQWLDADDLLAHDKISKQLKESENGLNSRTLLSSAFGCFYYRYQKARFFRTHLWQNLSPLEWFLIKFNENVWMTNSSWLVSRMLTELAGPWDERLTLDDDGEYFCRVIAASEKIKFVPEAICYYRQWNTRSLSRDISYKACESLFLSLSLCINYLLSLEDSERTRAACKRYLETWYYYFYPEKEDLLIKVNKLAHELGGNLSPPELNWKYSIVNKIFGWKTTKKIRDTVRKTKSLVFIGWDKLLYKISV